MKHYAIVGLLKVTREKVNRALCGLIKRHETHKMQYISTEEAVNFFFESRDNFEVFKSLDEAKAYAARKEADMCDKRFTVPIYEVDLSDEIGEIYNTTKYPLPDEQELNRHCVRDIVGVHIFHPNFQKCYYELDDMKKRRIMLHNNALELGRLFSQGPSL